MAQIGRLDCRDEGNPVCCVFYDIYEMSDDVSTIQDTRGIFMYDVRENDELSEDGCASHIYIGRDISGP